MRIRWLNIVNRRQIIVCGVSSGICTSLIVFILSLWLDYISWMPSSPDLAAKKINLHLLAILAITVFPLIETFLVQFLTIEVLGIHTRKRRFLAFFISVVLFSWAHLSSETTRQPVFSLLIGAILSFLYISGKVTSTRAAFTTTLIAHATHNGILVAILLYWSSWMQLVDMGHLGEI